MNADSPNLSPLWEPATILLAQRGHGEAMRPSLGLNSSMKAKPHLRDRCLAVNPLPH